MSQSWLIKTKKSVLFFSSEIFVDDAVRALNEMHLLCSSVYKFLTVHSFPRKEKKFHWCLLPDIGFQTSPGTWPENVAWHYELFWTEKFELKVKIATARGKKATK